MNQVKFGTMEMYSYKRNGIEQQMPILSLEKDTKAGVLEGYLSPFRRRGFQVSETFDGQGDLGSVYEGMDMKYILERMGKQYFRKYCYAQCVVAINRFANYGGSAATVPTSFEATEALEEFVDKVVEYVESSI